MTESPEDRLKRLKLRSMRRGIKEMDLILSAFADAQLDALGAGELLIYDDLLGENDHDLYQWITGQMPVPGRFSGLIERISTHTRQG